MLRRPQRFATGLVDLDMGRQWDLLEGRSKTVVTQRLSQLDPAELAAIGDDVIDPFAGYKAAVRDMVPVARRTADRFHIVRLANTAVTDVRCRRQQELTGHRGRKADPFYRARRDLLRARERLTDRQAARVAAAFAAGPAEQLWAAWVAKEGIRTSTASPSSPTPRRSSTLARHLPCLRHRRTRTARHHHRPLERRGPELLRQPPHERPNRRPDLTIKAVKRSGHSFRNFATYRLRVLYRCS
jgi:transposase